VSIPPGPYLGARLSPDGQRLVYRGAGTKPGVWVYDLAQSNLTRVTAEGNNRWPLWTPDGRAVVYSRPTDDGGWTLLLHDLNQGTREALAPGYGPAAWSPDGRMLVYTAYGDPANPEDFDIWFLMRNGADVQTQRWLGTSALEGHPALSPDGAWLAYASYGVGDFEVYVDSFPEPGTRQKVSTNGGREPVWAPTGGQLYYLGRCPDSATNSRPVYVLAVSMDEGSRPIFGRPRLVGQVPDLQFGFPLRQYDLAPDGERFLFLQAVAAATPDAWLPRELHVVLNWFEELKAKAGG